jgi:hypothetical protein
MVRWWWLAAVLWACDDAGGSRRLDGGGDGAPGDRGAPPDGTVLDAARDGSPLDAGRDAAADGAVPDAGPDSGPDAAPDAATDGGPDAAGDAAPYAAPDAAPPTCAPAEQWTRASTRLGQAAVFTELFVEPAGDGRREYLELYNPLAIDLDLSGWRLAGAVQLTFPPGTWLRAQERRVVAAAPADGALGPWEGRIEADEAIELRNGRDRLMERVAWGDSPLWPAVPPAGGALARFDLSQPADRAEAWVHADPSPGTAGAAPLRTARVLVANEAVWRHSGVPEPGWTEPDFDDGAWEVGPAPFFVGGPVEAAVRVRVTADNHYAAFVGAPDGAGLRLIGQDDDGNWPTPVDHEVVAQRGEHLFLAAWEARGDAGSPQMVIAQATDAQGLILATDPAGFEAVLGPPEVNPGPAGVPDVAAVAALAAGPWQAPGASAPVGSPPWGLGDAFDPSASFLWVDTFEPASATNVQETFALFRSRRALVQAAGTELLAVPRTAAFRTSFEFEGAGGRLQLTLTADDGAVVSLNGVEVARHNVAREGLALAPGGAPVVLELDAAALRMGQNTLAVAVVQAPGDVNDLRFAATLTWRPLPEVTEAAPEASPIVFSELMYHPAEGDTEWLELHNRGESPVDLTGWRIVDAVGFVFPPGTVLDPGASLVVARDLAEFRALHPEAPLAGEYRGSLGNDGERVALVDPCGAVADAVRWADGGRWPTKAGGDGASLELVDVRAHNGVPEAWAASETGGDWQVLSWRGVAAPSGPDGAWREVVLGLLDAGEVLIDDLVVRGPDGQNLIQNGTFDAGLGAWRVLGTHERSEVVPDPDDPGNPVLRLVATGPTEHQHNHAESTLTGAVQDGLEYEISLRARWVAGSDQLNVRLYFNRLARTLRLGRPGPGGTPGAPNAGAVANAGPTFAGFGHLPAVPGAGEPVDVVVAVDDPDGVDAVTLWLRPDGGAPEAVPMATTDGRVFRATAPGRPLGSVVQLWIEATDAAGGVATCPAGGPASRALYPVDVPRRGPGGLPALRIVLTGEDSVRFHEPTNLMSNAATGATVIFNETEVFHDIGVRAKGSQRGRPVAVRLGYNLRFDPLRPFRGVYETVSVDRSEGVRFGQRELLMDLVMARAGALSAEYNDLAHVVAPRPEQTGAGLLQLARFSNDMLDAQFEDGSDGALYEYELIYFPTTTDDGTPEGLKRPQPDSVVGTNLRDLGPDPEAWRWFFLLKNNRRADDFDGIMALGRLFALPDAELVVAAPDVIDVDEWLRSAAFAALSGAIDHYGSGAQHNTWFYQRPSDGRLLYFPHDMDFYPGEPTQPIVAQNDLRRLLTQPAWRRVFYRHLRQIIATAYNDAYMARWRDQLGALLPGQDFAGHHRFLVGRAAWVTDGAPDALNRVFAPVDFAISTPAGDVVGEVATLEGTAGLDVAVLTVGGEPVPVIWLDNTRWQVEVGLELGPNLVEIQALDEAGNMVGAGSVVLARVE